MWLATEGIHESNEMSMDGVITGAGEGAEFLEAQPIAEAETAVAENQLIDLCEEGVGSFRTAGT